MHACVSPRHPHSLGRCFQRGSKGAVSHDDENSRRDQLCEGLSNDHEQTRALLGRQTACKADHLLQGEEGGGRNGEGGHWPGIKEEKMVGMARRTPSGLRVPTDDPDLQQ